MGTDGERDIERQRERVSVLSIRLHDIYIYIYIYRERERDYINRIGFVGFYSISTIVSYLMSNPISKYIMYVVSYDF